MKIRKYETRNKQTGLEFLECITSDGGTKGVTAIYGRLAGLEDERGQDPASAKLQTSQILLFITITFKPGEHIQLALEYK